MEWVQARDGTEARRVDDGIEVRRQGRVDSTVYRVKEANRDWLAKCYPSLFDEQPAAEMASELPTAPATPPKKKRTSKKKSELPTAPATPPKKKRTSKKK